MARSPHLGGCARPTDFSLSDELSDSERPKPFAHPVDLDFSFDGSSAYLSYERQRILVHLVIRGDQVPEIPDIENLGDSGWEFSHVTHRRGRIARGSTITFFIPKGGEAYIAQMLGYYTLLYGS